MLVLKVPSMFQEIVIFDFRTTLEQNHTDFLSCKRKYGYTYYVDRLVYYFKIMKPYSH